MGREGVFIGYMGYVQEGIGIVTVNNVFSVIEFLINYD